MCRHLLLLPCLPLLLLNVFSPTQAFVTTSCHNSSHLEQGLAYVNSISIYGIRVRDIKQFVRRYLGDEIGVDGWNYLERFRFSTTPIGYREHTVKEWVKHEASRAYHDIKNEYRRKVYKQNLDNGGVFVYRKLWLLPNGWIHQMWWDRDIKRVTRNLQLEKVDEVNLFLNQLFRDTRDFEREILNSTELTGDRFFPIMDRDELASLIGEVSANFSSHDGWTTVTETLNCYYDYMDNANSTFYHAIMKAVRRDVYTSYVQRLVTSLQLLLASPDLVADGAVNIGQATFNNLQNIDYDDMWVNLYKLLLGIRTDLVKVDVKGFFDQLTEFHKILAEGWWRLMTDRWPSMDKFLDNLIETIRTDAFWDELDEIYIDTIHQVHEYYKHREEELKVFIETQLIPAVGAAVEFVEQSSGDVEHGVDAVVKEIEKVQLGTNAEMYIFRPLIERLSRYYVACYSSRYHHPDFDLMEELNAKKLTNSLYQLIFSNWPEDEVVPDGTDTFVNRFVDVFWRFIVAIVGTCH